MTGGEISLTVQPATTTLLDAVRALGLPPLRDIEPWVPAVAAVEDPAALRVDTFGPYFRGIRYGTRGLAGRLVDEHDRAEAIAMSDMAAAFLDAWKVRREAQSEPRQPRVSDAGEDGRRARPDLS